MKHFLLFFLFIRFCGSPPIQAASGDADSLNAKVGGNFGSYVSATAVQPDGRIIIAGQFTSVLDQPRNRIARLNADGTLDMGFNPNVNGEVSSVAVQADGRILIAGYFTNVGGVVRNYIARLAGDGSLDTGFNPDADYQLNCLAVQADGKILLGGGFSSAGGKRRIGIARVAANGTLDASFDPDLNQGVLCITMQADGNILIGGGFTSVGGIPRNRIARVTAAGTLDMGFDPDAGHNVYGVAVQADGRILLWGSFNSMGGQYRSNMARVAANGTLDLVFNPNLGSEAFSVALQADGRILLGGRFMSVDKILQNYIARLSPNGTFDVSFNPKPNFPLRCLAIQGDGKILLGGEFSTVGGAARSSFARLFNEPATQSLTAVDSSKVLWTRGGSAPEVSQVNFELSTDGSVSYTPLAGTASRVGSTANWELTGLSLPTTGHLRARGRTANGNFNGGSGLIEFVGAFTAPSVTFPTFTALSPTSGSTAGGTIVTINGTGFTGATAVIIGGVAAAFSIVSDTQITAVAPTHSAGIVSVLVSAPGTSAANTSYTYLTPPTVNLTSNKLLSYATTLTIIGTGFDAATPGNNRVDFAPAGSGIVSAATTGSLTVTGLSGLILGALHAVVTTNGQSSGASVQVGTVVAPAPGDVDPLNAKVVGNYVRATAMQPDGKIIIAGQFTSVLGQVRNNMARLHPDGTLDIAFNPNVNNSVSSVAVQSDGSILLGGEFTMVGGISRNHIARVTAAGITDTSFNPNVNLNVSSVVVQADGGILLGGPFSTVGGTGRNHIARVAPDGTLDQTFNPNVDGPIESIVVQSDGKILFGGQFSAVGVTKRNYLARVAADGTLDPGFNSNVGGQVRCVALQADGRILLGGGFASVGGIGRNFIARVAADGTVDTSFINHKLEGSYVSSVSVQADRRILLAGSFYTMVGGIRRNYVARLGTDGTPDTGFDPKPDNVVHGLTVQSDGSILLGGEFTSVGRIGRNYFARVLNLPATQTLTVADTSQILWTRGGSSPEVSGTIFELSTDSGMSYTPLPGRATRVGTTANWQLTGLALPASGSLRSRGRTFGGYSNGSGSLVESLADFTTAIVTLPTVTAISPTSGSTAGGTKVTITGTGFTGATAVTIGGVPATFTVISASSITTTTPPHAAGVASVQVSTPGVNIENALYTYVTPPTVTPSINKILNNTETLTIFGTGFDSVVLGNNRVDFTPVGSGTIKAATPTTLTVASLSGLTVGALNAVVTTNGQSSGVPTQVATVAMTKPGDPDTLNVRIDGSSVSATVVQPDGRIIIAGDFASVLDQPRQHIARLNADGTLDPGFKPNVNFSVHSLALQEDGRILIAGQFTNVGGIERNHIARLTADGALDSSFHPILDNAVLSLAVQADQRILLGGQFTTVGGLSHKHLARLAVDGPLDQSFNPDLGTNPNEAVFSIVVQADGKILLGGQFAAVGGLGRNNLARVNADGTVDPGFNPNVNNRVHCLTVQSDGKILLGGQFDVVGGIMRNNFARVAADGSLDAAFNPNPSGVVDSVVVQTDRRILIAGLSAGISRVGVDGKLEVGFNPFVGGYVNSVAMQQDGTILLGGGITRVGGSGRNRFARLLNDRAAQRLTVPDNTQVLWSRSGTSPEIYQTTFELSRDGGNTYTRLPGTATRIGNTSNWQLTGLSLPDNGHVRARGRANGGVLNGSSGLIESVVAFPIPLTALETWRQVHFGRYDNTGPAADKSDFDNDGLVNLIEFAFGQDPTNAASAQLSPLLRSSGDVSVSFSTPPGVSGITYGAEWSFSMLGGGWSAIPDTGTEPQHRFIVSMTGQKKAFFRLVVTADGP